MTLRDILHRTMQQLGEDVEELPEVRTLLVQYINEGQVDLLRGQESIARLTQEFDKPDFDQSYHGALADYATYRYLGNGSLERQRRGDFFYARYIVARGQLVQKLSGGNRIVHKYR